MMMPKHKFVTCDVRREEISNQKFLLLFWQLLEEFRSVWRLLYVDLSYLLDDLLKFAWAEWVIADKREFSLAQQLLLLLKSLHFLYITCLLLVRVATRFDG